jgi:hypothetical protein
MVRLIEASAFSLIAVVQDVLVVVGFGHCTENVLQENCLPCGQPQCDAWRGNKSANCPLHVQG